MGAVAYDLQPQDEKHVEIVIHVDESLEEHERKDLVDALDGLLNWHTPITNFPLGFTVPSSAAHLLVTGGEATVQRHLHPLLRPAPRAAAQVGVEELRERHVLRVAGHAGG